jgi:hypothetical protein
MYSTKVPKRLQQLKDSAVGPFTLHPEDIGTWYVLLVYIAVFFVTDDIVSVTWRWTTDVPETHPVVYRLTKKGIKGMLFEKKVIFLLRSREIAWLRQCGFTTNYDIRMTRAATSPFYIASFK